MTPEQQAEQDKLPSLQYKVVCGPAFAQNTTDHKAIVEKLDLIIERQAQVKEELQTTKGTTQEVYEALIQGNGDSIVTQVRLHDKAIEKLQNNSAKVGNRWWDFIKLVIAAALPLIFLWLSHKL